MRYRHCVLLVVVASGAFGGCYAYRGGAIPRIDANTLAVRGLMRVVVTNIRVDSNTGGDTDVAKIATTEVNSALAGGGADVRQSGTTADPDMTIDVLLRAKGSVAGQAASGFICGATFLLVPAYAGFEITFDADVTLRDGSKRQYHYADRYTTWIELFLLPVSNQPDRVLQDLIADMSRSLVRDLQRAGVLSPPGGVPSPATALARGVHQYS